MSEHPIVSKPSNDLYRREYDRIFKRKKSKKYKKYKDREDETWQMKGSGDTEDLRP